MSSFGYYLCGGLFVVRHVVFIKLVTFKVILSILFWFLGLFVTSMTLISSLICLFFGIPTTNKLQKVNMLIQNNSIIKRYFISFGLLILIFIIISFLIYQFGSDTIIHGYFGGMIFSILIGIWKIGKSKDNISDYVKTQHQYFIGSIEDVTSFLIEK